MSVQEYIEKHELSKRVEEVINACVKTKPDEPLSFMVIFAAACLVLSLYILEWMPIVTCLGLLPDHLDRGGDLSCVAKLSRQCPLSSILNSLKLLLCRPQPS